MQEMLTRPRFEPGNNYLPLEIKSDMKTTPIFKLSYETYREHFQRTVLAAGYRDPIRPYALRVGAGNAFDGVLSATLRNHILDQSSETFLRSYQTTRVRANLSSLIFGAEDSQQNNHLFEELRQQSIRRVPGVPIRRMPYQELLQRFGHRKDVGALQADVDASADSILRKRAQSRLKSHLNALNDLVIKQEVQEHIAKTDSLALQGLSQELSGPDLQTNEDHDVAARIASILVTYRQAMDRRTDKEATRASFIALQSALYGRRVPPCRAKLEDLEVLQATRALPEPCSPRSRSFICLLCRTTLKNRHSLTRHTISKHTIRLSQSHDCPACSTTIKAGADKWCVHVELYHRHETVAPNITTEYVESTRATRSRTVTNGDGVEAASHWH